MHDEYTPDDYDLEELARMAPEELAAPTGWDDATAERIMAGYSALTRKRGRTEELWQARVDDVMRRRDELLDPMTERLQALAASLEVWAVAKRDVAGVKSTRLPSGTVATRTGQPKVVVDELYDDDGRRADHQPADLIHSGVLGVDEPWCRELVRVIPEQHAVAAAAVKDALKAGHLKATEHGTLVVADSGAIVPGVRLEPAELTATVTPATD